MSLLNKIIISIYEKGKEKNDIFNVIKSILTFFT